MSNGFGFQGGGGGSTTPAVESVSGTAPIVSSGGTNPAISIPQATSSVSGFLRSTDFNTFNAKQNALVSGVNIKTINSNSLLASGDIVVQPTLISGVNIRTINSQSLLASGNIAVQPTLISGTNIRTINGTTLLSSGDVVVQPTLVSGTNIKTINGNSILGSGNIVAGGNQSRQSESSLGQYVAAGGFTNTLLYNSASPIITTLGQVIDVDVLVINVIFGTAQTMRVYLNNSPTLTGAVQIANYQYTPTQTNQMFRYFRRFIVSRNNSTLNWYLRSIDPYVFTNDFTATGTGSVLTEYPLGFNAPTVGGYFLITLNGAAELLCVTIDY